MEQSLLAFAREKLTNLCNFLKSKLPGHRTGMFCCWIQNLISTDKGTAEVLQTIYAEMQRVESKDLLAYYIHKLGYADTPIDEHTKVLLERYLQLFQDFYATQLDESESGKQEDSSR